LLDVAKTPIIRNTTGKWLAKDTKINWPSSDGDQGTIILQTALSPFSSGELNPPGIDDEIQGIWKAGQIYTCTAYAVYKMQLKEAELEIICHPQGG